MILMILDPLHDMIHVWAWLSFGDSHVKHADFQKWIVFFSSFFFLGKFSVSKRLFVSFFLCSHYIILWLLCQFFSGFNEIIPNTTILVLVLFQSLEVQHCSMIDGQMCTQWQKIMITYLSRFGLSSELSSFINDGCKLNRRLKCFPIISIYVFVCGMQVNWYVEAFFFACCCVDDIYRYMCDGVEMAHANPIK